MTREGMTVVGQLLWRGVSYAYLRKGGRYYVEVSEHGTFPEWLDERGHASALEAMEAVGRAVSERVADSHAFLSTYDKAQK